MQQARSYIEAESLELAKCEKEIARLNDALAKLEAHRVDLVERIERHRSWFSPIRRLPVEILVNILAFVFTPESGTFALDVGLRPISAPVLAFTHVSHHWRVVINASPSLWSLIRLRLPYGRINGDQIDQIQSLLIHYLTKSRDHPLHLVNFHCAGYLQDGQINPIPRLLAPHIPRIAGFDLRGDVDYPPESRIPKWLADSLRNDIVPKLSDMTIYHAFPEYRILPCHQLRVLKIVCTDPWPLEPVPLEICNNLHSLTLHLFSPSRHEMEDLVEIPSLRRLEIAYCRHADKPAFNLPQFVLPSLSSFRISSYNDSRSLELVTDLVRRSGCHLEEFTMEIRSGRYNVTDVDLRNFLTSCPELSHFEVVVADPSRKNMHPGAFVCQLLDVLSPVSSYQTPIPSPKLSYVIASERWSTLDPETVDVLLGKLEARIGALKDYRARVPVPRWKWDLRFGALPECAPDVLEGFRSRIEKLAKSGLKWAPLPVPNESK
ncbi:hypothetical protein VNI00_016794 [Paramarasmius palmivorus]|uniref:F-box domain-containing protein n=1 Tax=Paramarasmius palmivorus TaxID=297713 RepID=A0AAW0BBQ4_9AGAR